MKKSLLFVAVVSALLFASCGHKGSVSEIMDTYSEAVTGYQDNIYKFLGRHYDELAAGDSALMAKYEELFREYIDFNKKTIKENGWNEVGAKAFISASTLIDDDNELADLAKQLKKKVVEGNDEVKAILASLKIRKTTSVGKTFTDFTVTTVEGFEENGDAIYGEAKLSDYVGKGKYILVDFWASWCGPCRGEIPNIKAVYEQFACDKFDVLSIAVWDKPADSYDAIEEEGLTWNQMVLGAESKSVPTELYGIAGIPQIMLFGPDGTILKRDLRGEAIAEAVAEALGE